MSLLRFFLLASTLAIYLLTYLAITSQGINWPLVAIEDIVALNWRSQFDVDFIIHLVLLASWISWREGFTTKGHVFGVLSIVMGGMFSFPYLIRATYLAKGDPVEILLGSRATGHENAVSDCR